MRVTIESPSDTLVLGDYRLGETYGWHLLKDGLEGWYEPPDPRVDVTAVPQMDGAYWPGQILAAHRILTIRGAVVNSSSTLEGGRVRERLAALTGVKLSICVEDGMGPRWVSGFISSQIGITAYVSEWDTEFSLIVTCPDPVKYGPPVTRSAVGGVVEVENTGTAPTWPVIDVVGQVSVVRAVLGDRLVEWHGSSSQGLHLDTHDGLPLTPSGEVVGSLVHDDLFQVEPGVHGISVSTTPAGRAVNVTVRSGWK